MKYLFFFNALFILIYSFGQKRDIFSPAILFSLIWSLVLGLAELKLSNLQHEWSAYAWLLMLLGPISFLLGVFFLNSCLSFNSSKINFDRQLSSNNIPETRIFSITLIYFVIYLLCYILNALIKGFIPFFAFAPGVVRTNWGIFGIGMIIHAAPIILFLATEYWVICNKTTRYFIAMTFIFLITFVSYLLLLQRYNIMLWACMSLVFIYYSKRRLFPKVFIVGSIILIGTMLFINTFRFVRHIESYVYLTSKMHYSVKYAAYTEPYMYIVMGLENCARGFDRLDHFAWGYFSLNPILTLTGTRRVIGSLFQIEEMPFLISGYNTYPFHWYYYYDFGIVGVVFLSMVLGGCMAYVYHKLLIHSNFTILSLYSICVFVMLMSFYLNPLTMLNFIFVIAVTLISQRYITSTHR